MLGDGQTGHRNPHTGGKMSEVSHEYHQQTDEDDKNPKITSLTSLCIYNMFLCMKRTTLTIEDDLFVQLKKRAASQGRSMGSLVNDLLRQAIASQSRRKSFRLELDGWDAELQPGVDILDRDKLFDLMNGR